MGLVKQSWVHYIADMCSGVVSCIGSLSAGAKWGDAMVHGYTNAMNVMDNSLPCFLFPPLSPSSSPLGGILHARHEIKSGRVSHRLNCWMGYSVKLMI
jgi:hypothetical protein